MMEQKWKVTFYGEGSDWSYHNLTYAQANEKVDKCPNEYMAFMEPSNVGMDDSKRKELLIKEIEDVRKSTPNLGIIGRVKYVQNNQDKYPELMKLGYHDMQEVL